MPEGSGGWEYMEPELAWDRRLGWLMVAPLLDLGKIDQADPEPCPSTEEYAESELRVLPRCPRAAASNFARG